MKVNDNEILLEFHQSRIDQYIPAKFFMQEHHIIDSKKNFLLKYRTWRRKFNIPFIEITVEQYLQWFAKHYKVDYEEMLNFYNTTKPTGNQPLAIAMSIYYSLHPDVDRKHLLEDCGLSNTTLRTYLANNIRGSEK